MSDYQVIRSEHTNIHAGQSKTRHRVEVVSLADNGIQVCENFSSRREAQQFARRKQDNWGGKIVVKRTARGVQYAHEL